MDQTTKEYVESALSADTLERQIEQLSEAIALEDTGMFGAKYIEKRIINNDTLEYTVLPSSIGDYAVIDEIDAGSRYDCGVIGSGPMTRLRENGFIIDSAKAYVGADQAPRTMREHGEHLPDAFVAVYITYVGAEHPIIEYWDDES